MIKDENMEQMISDRSNVPTIEEITNNFADGSQKRFITLIEFINNTFHAKSEIKYSTCSAKPGWNIKYKKSGKAICTIYPEFDSITVLIVLNDINMKYFEALKNEFSAYTCTLYDKCKLFNGTKWLMISVTNNDILKDVKNLLTLKMQHKE